MRVSIIEQERITEREGATEGELDRTIPTIILLIAGELVPQAAGKIGTYHDVFALFFQESISFGRNFTQFNPSQHQFNSGTVKIQLVSFLVVQNNPVPLHYPSQNLLSLATALFISGSASNAFDDEPWIKELINFTKKIITIHNKEENETKTEILSTNPNANPNSKSKSKNEIKLIGICFGHQIISIALGGKVERNSVGWELGLEEVELTEWGRFIFPDRLINLASTAPSSLDQLNRPHALNLFQVHRDIVTYLPEFTHNIGTSKKSEIQGIIKFKNELNSNINHQNENLNLNEKNNKENYMKNMNFLRENTIILTLQFHPEYQGFILEDLLDARTNKGTDFSIIDRINFLSARDSLVKFPPTSSNNYHHHHDGPFVGFKLLQILHILQ